jgi:hypothetical protein
MCCVNEGDANAWLKAQQVRFEDPIISPRQYRLWLRRAMRAMDCKRPATPSM